MKFMVLIPTSKEIEAGGLPDPREFEAMDRFGEEMVKAGVMVAGEGLQPSSKGARMTFSDTGEVTVVDGPFTEAKELIGGFFIMQVKSKEEALAWVRRAPFKGATIEIRQLHDPMDFVSLDPTGELRAKDPIIREQMEANSKKR